MFPHELEKIHDFLDKHDWATTPWPTMNNSFDTDNELLFGLCECKSCGKRKWRSFRKSDINKEWP